MPINKKKKYTIGKPSKRKPQIGILQDPYPLHKLVYPQDPYPLHKLVYPQDPYPLPSTNL